MAAKKKNKIRLADATYYCPDFSVVLADGSLEEHEVKAWWKSRNGPAWEDDARVKVKVAAETWPARFVGVCRRPRRPGPPAPRSGSGRRRRRAGARLVRGARDRRRRPARLAEPHPGRPEPLGLRIEGREDDSKLFAVLPLARQRDLQAVAPPRLLVALEGDLGRTFSFTRLGATYSMSVLDALLQVATHGHHHHGQMATRARQAGLEGLPNIEATLAKLNAFFAAEEAEKTSSEALLNRFANHFVPTVEEAVQ